MFTRTRDKTKPKPVTWVRPVTKSKRRYIYPLDSCESVWFHQDSDQEWHDEDTCKTERIGHYARVDKTALLLSDDGKLVDWQGRVVGTHFQGKETIY